MQVQFLSWALEKKDPSGLFSCLERANCFARVMGIGDVEYVDETRDQFSRSAATLKMEVLLWRNMYRICKIQPHPLLLVAVVDNSIGLCQNCDILAEDAWCL